MTGVQTCALLISKPVTWIVVAKDHYGDGSGVTLLSEELIGRFIFDNRTGVHHGGVNNWGDSNHIRPWLNSSGTSYTGAGFFNAFSNEFKNAVLLADIPNKGFKDYNSPGRYHYNYNTQDRVFIPSTTEMGDNNIQNTYEIGTVFPYFNGAADADRIAKLGTNNSPYWTRSPNSLEDIVHCFLADGSHGVNWIKAKGNNGVRPTLNISGDILVSGMSNAGGVYEIFYQ